MELFISFCYIAFAQVINNRFGVFNTVFKRYKVLRVKEGGGVRLAQRGALAGPAYGEGIRSPRKPWAQATRDGEDNWAAGVQAAIQSGSFGRGVQAAGDDKWMSRSLEVGQSRFVQGMSGAAEKWETGFAPYRTVLTNLTLTPRGPKGDPRNMERAAQVAAAMHAEKLRR